MTDETIADQAVPEAPRPMKKRLRPNLASIWLIVVLLSGGGYLLPGLFTADNDEPEVAPAFLTKNIVT